MMRTSDLNSIDYLERKALTSFSLGSSGFFLPPELSSEVLSCLEDQTDVAGLMGSTTISGSSIKWLVDNTRFDEAIWGCTSDCWAASHIQDVTSGLGEVEIKPESLCVTSSVPAAT